jgi:hypothetical protein
VAFAKSDAGAVRASEYECDGVSYGAVITALRDVMRGAVNDGAACVPWLILVAVSEEGSRRKVVCPPMGESQSQ